MAGRFSWLGGKQNAKDDKESSGRAARHKRARPSDAGQRFESGGYCPAGYYHTGRCRHRI
jgi:hypothetical protein